MAARWPEDPRTAPHSSPGYGLLADWIKPARVYPGDPDAHIRGTGVPVWAIVTHFLRSRQNRALTAREYGVQEEAVDAAVSYYHLHRDLIDARIAANEAAAN